MAERQQTDQPVVHGLKTPPDWDKKVVLTIKSGRITCKITSAEGKLFLTPKEARLMGIKLRHQQRIDVQRQRLQKRLTDRRAAAVGV